MYDASFRALRYPPQPARFAAVCSAAATPGRYAAGVGRKCVWLEHAWGKAAGAGPDVWISGRDHSCSEYGTSMLRYEGISVTAG